VHPDQGYACPGAQIVLRACKDMGLGAHWEPSNLSESQYVTVWREDPRKIGIQVRFSDHPVAERYECRCWERGGDCLEHQFETAFACGHEQVDGSCYDAIVWLSRIFERPLPKWVVDENPQSLTQAPPSPT
jgi:hypothetical protein